MPPDELIMLTGMIIASILYVPFRWGVVKIKAVSRRCLSLPLFFVAWLLITSIFVLVFPHLSWEGMPLGFGAAIPTMMPGMSFIRWAGLFDWFNSYTLAQGIMFLVASVVLNFLLYWTVDFVGTSIYQRVAKRLRQ